MSRRKRRKTKANRPRSRPIQQSHQEVKKSEPRSPLLTRRRALITLVGTGGAAAAWRAGLFDVFDDEKELEESDEQDLSKKVTIGSRLSDFEKWSEKFELPKVEIAEKNSDYVGKMDITNKHKTFFGRFDAAKAKLESEFGRTDITEDEKQKVIETFLAYTIGGYQDLIGDKTDKFKIGTAEFNVMMAQVNAALAMHGVNIRTAYDLDLKGLGIKLFEIDHFDTVRISGIGPAFELPLAHLSDEQEFLQKHGIKTEEVNALYNPVGRLILARQETTERQCDKITKTYKERFSKVSDARKINFRSDANTAKSFFEMGIMHEGMHAALDSMGISPYGNHIKRNGDINTGKYTLPSYMYENVSGQNLHELVANGFGLMNSGKNAPVVVLAIITSLAKHEKYKLAAMVLLEEIFASPNIPDDIKEKALIKNGDKRTVNIDNLVYLIDQLSMTEIHRIGERMAKLGIYLTQ